MNQVLWFTATLNPRKTLLLRMIDLWLFNCYILDKQCIEADHCSFHFAHKKNFFKLVYFTEYIYVLVFKYLLKIHQEKNDMSFLNLYRTKTFRKRTRCEISLLFTNCAHKCYHILQTVGIYNFSVIMYLFYSYKITLF